MSKKFPYLTSFTKDKTYSEIWLYQKIILNFIITFFENLKNWKICVKASIKTRATAIIINGHLGSLSEKICGVYRAAKGNRFFFLLLDSSLVNQNYLIIQPASVYENELRVFSSVIWKVWTFCLKLSDFCQSQSKLVKSYHKSYHKSKATIKGTISYFLDKNLG